MRKLTLILLILLISCTSMEPDKKLHAQYGAVIGAGTVLALNMIEYDGNRPLTATLACSSVGLLKELSDENRYGGFDSKDLAVTSLFCGLGAYGFNWALNWNIKPTDGGAIINYKREF